MGARDPEVEDAVDVAAYFTSMFSHQPDVFKQMLQSVLTRVRAMDPSWDRPTCTATVPEAPVQGKIVQLWLPVWKLGFTNAHAVKGKSRSSQITDCITNFLERPYSSATDPLDVLMPRGSVVGDQLPDFSVRHSIGFAKSLTCRLLLFATVDMRWKDSDIRLFLPELQALFSVKAVYSPGTNARDPIQKSIGGSSWLLRGHGQTSCKLLTHFVNVLSMRAWTLARCFPSSLRSSKMTLGGDAKGTLGPREGLGQSPATQAMDGRTQGLGHASKEVVGRCARDLRAPLRLDRDAPLRQHSHGVHHPFCVPS